MENEKRQAYASFQLRDKGSYAVLALAVQGRGVGETLHKYLTENGLRVVSGAGVTNHNDIHSGADNIISSDSAEVPVGVIDDILTKVTEEEDLDLTVGPLHTTSYNDTDMYREESATLSRLSEGASEVLALQLGRDRNSHGHPIEAYEVDLNELQRKRAELTSMLGRTRKSWV